jgi:serine/threonine protein kinase/tetratricopeptide (TPR) repeat protein
MQPIHIGSYQILGELGKGGMGVVYRARHVASEFAVALKTVKSDSARSAHWLASLRREIYALTRIRHPGVVRIVDHGVHHGLPWYAMDLLEGERLEDFCRRVWSPYRWGTLGADASARLSRTNSLDSEGDDDSVRPPRTPPPLQAGKPPAAADQLKTVLQLMRRVCATLAFLHGEGFINCDLTPRNILLVAGEPVIIDFGLTAQHPGTSREAPESPHAFGTLPYMSPEQVRGEFVDARSDLYSVGCVLYELVTGRPPFTGTHRLAFISQHLSATPAPPSELVSGVSAGLDRLILKLLEKDLSTRFGHADEVAAELAEFAGDARRLPHFPPPRSYLYRSRLVGRERIIEQLVALRNRTLQGKGSVAFLGGESGVGKTRVALELTRLEPGLRLRVLTSEASPLAAQDSDTLAGSPLYALRPLLCAIADRCQEGGPALTARLLGERRSVLARYEPLLADVPSFEPLEPEVALSEHASRQRLFRYLSETLALFALDRPVLWLVDDIGWADKLSLAFLRSLGKEYFEEVPLFLLATYRSEEPNDSVTEMAKQAHVTHLTLERLDNAAVASMVEDMLALRALPNHFQEFVSERGEGNPFFVAEYLRAAVNERLLFRGEQNKWQFQPARQGSSEPFETLPLPRSLRELVERRLRSLTPAALQALLAAATMGRNIDLSVLPEVAMLDSDTLLHSLDELLRCHVLEETKGHWRFAHDQLRAVAYGRLSAEPRRAMHERAARSLEARWRQRPDAHEIWPTLGHHFERAGAAESAARYLKLAAAHASATYANAQAIQLHRRAIQLLTELASNSDSQWEQALLEQQESLGDVLFLTSQRADARKTFELALGRAPTEQVVTRARLCRKLGKTWEAEHQHALALHWYQLGRKALEAHDFESHPSVRDEWIQMHVEELWVYYWLNRVDDMEATSAKVAPVMRLGASTTQRSKFTHARAMKNLRRDRYLVGEETLELARQTFEVCSTGQAPLELPMVQFFYGMCLLLHGSLAAAEIELEKALALAQRAGEFGHQARCLTYLAMLARRRGQLDQTERCANQCLSLALRSELREYVAGAWAHQSWVALRRGDRERAHNTADQAIQAWRQFPAAFPFLWWALLPMLELEVERGAFACAIECAESLLEPAQHAFSSTVLQQLKGAVEHWHNGAAGEAQRGLEGSLATLRNEGYS